MSMTASSDNPYFRLSLTFDPELYFGSLEWIELTLQMISNTPPRSIELIGLPGMGKSSLLRYLANPAGALAKNRDALQPPFRPEPARIFPVLVEFRLLPTDMHPFVYLQRRFQIEYKAYRERAKPSLADGLPASGDEPDLTGPAAATAAVEEALTALGANGVRTVFIFDDFHLAFGRLSQAETTRLRPWRDRVAFIISTERRLDKVNARAAGSPFFQSLPIVRFGGLGSVEAARMLSKPAEAAKWPLHSDDIEFALNHADGHPYLLITAGATLWEARANLGVPKGRKAAVSKEYPQLLLSYFTERFAPTFQMYWEHLDSAEQAAMYAAAGAESVPESSALISLEELGLLKFDPKAGRHVPFSPLFGEFIRTMSPQTAERWESGVYGVEASLLEYLQRNANRVCTFAELSQEVWGERPSNSLDEDRIQRRVQVTVSRLRKKLLEAGEGDIISVRKMGYRLVPS